MFFTKPVKKEVGFCAVCEKNGATLYLGEVYVHQHCLEAYAKQCLGVTNHASRPS